MIFPFNFSFSPYIIFENKEYAILYKPRAMPTAPLNLNEKGNLLSWFLEKQPTAAAVMGKKNIEAGLIHRLDTATTGLVLIAKTQKCFDYLNYAQEKNLIKKTYIAFSEILTQENIKQCNFLPQKIISQFRKFGPKGKKVAPIFFESKKFNEIAKIYETQITNTKNIDGNQKIIRICCTLTQGYRHQVRTHLLSCGLPIYGDALYNPAWQNIDKNIIELHSYPLQLYATGIRFPRITQSYDMKNLNYISFSLQPPNKMIL